MGEQKRKRQMSTVEVSIGGDDPWLVSDRNYFAKHPDRKWRMRRAFSGEVNTWPEKFQRILDAGGYLCVIVYLHAPGHRQRFPFGSMQSDDPDDLNKLQDDEIEAVHALLFPTEGLQ